MLQVTLGDAVPAGPVVSTDSAMGAGTPAAPGSDAATSSAGASANAGDFEADINKLLQQIRKNLNAAHAELDMLAIAKKQTSPTLDCDLHSCSNPAASRRGMVDFFTDRPCQTCPAGA